MFLQKSESTFFALNMSLCEHALIDPIVTYLLLSCLLAKTASVASLEFLSQALPSLTFP